MFNQDERKIEWAVGNREMCFGRARKSRLFWFYFWRRNPRHLFVSGSWYCQIKRTRLIRFFVCIFYLMFSTWYSPEWIVRKYNVYQSQSQNNSRSHLYIWHHMDARCKQGISLWNLHISTSYLAERWVGENGYICILSWNI